MESNYAVNIGTDASVKNDDIEAITKFLKDWREMEFLSLEGSIATLEFMRDYSSDIMYWGENIKSESACKRKGEAWLSKAYNDAVKLFDPYNSDGICNKSVKNFIKGLENDITKIRHHLKKIRKTYGNNSEITEIESIISCNNIGDLIHDAVCEELSRNMYRLSDFSCYSALITCQEWNMTGIDNLNQILKVISPNVYWQYDCSEAWEKLNDDVSRKEESLFETYTLVIQNMLIRKCIQPVELLLDDIHYDFIQSNELNVCAG